jgi:hypothetical protein
MISGIRCRDRHQARVPAAGVGGPARSSGIVLSIEMSRMARSGREWHQLLELCALSGTLLGMWTSL